MGIGIKIKMSIPKSKNKDDLFVAYEKNKNYPC